LERPHGKSSISITIIFYFLWVNPSMPWRISLLTKGSFPIIPDNNGFDDRSKEKKENADNHPRRIVAEKRLTFPFPFVHHQPHDWKVDQKLMERRTHQDGCWDDCRRLLQAVSVLASLERYPTRDDSQTKRPEVQSSYERILMKERKKSKRIKGWSIKYKRESS
jgi:hypothetical protein